jgi:hypothetical protein
VDYSIFIVTMSLYESYSIQVLYKRLVNVSPFLMENKRGNRLAYVSGMHKKQA